MGRPPGTESSRPAESLTFVGQLKRGLGISDDIRE